MAVTVCLQFVFMLLVAAVAWFWGGQQFAVSAVMGGLAYIIPTIFTVLILSILKPFPLLAGVGFLIGEGLKIVLALIIMLLLFYFWYQQIVFIPFFAGLVAVSHLVFLISWKVQRNGK